MRLCFLAPGNSIHTQRWIKYMADEGHQVHLITLHKGPDMPEAEIHYLPSRGKLSYLLSLSKIRFLIRTIDPDILHAHYASSYGFLAACSGFHPLVISVWGWDVINFPRVSFLHRLLVKYALRKADHITATSKMLASTTAELTGVSDKVTVIPFGVDLLSFRERTGSSQKMEITIGIVKTLLPKYGIEYLIRAFSLVEKKFRNLNLMIVGAGPLRDNLHRLAQELGCVEKVYFVGQVPYSRVPEYLSKMDIFVVPSVDESESFGVAAVEASACGLPVVASNVGGLPEVVLDNRTGLLVPPRDAFAIAEAIIHLIENPGMRERFGKCGRELVMKNYSWQENAQRMENLYKKILRQS